jgi:glutathione S-transferase
MAPSIIYFAIPARAEVARLLLSIGKVDFVDKRITSEEWGPMKPSTPFGQLPCLEVDGIYLAQSAAIDRYCAQLAGVLPTDPWKAALADQAYFFCEDIWQTLLPTFRIKDAEEKLKARRELLTGALGDKLKLLTKLLENRPGKYVAGDGVTHADLAIFNILSTLKSGWLDGIPADYLNSYPVLKEFRNSIASVPEVAAFYAKESDDVRVNGYRQDA